MMSELIDEPSANPAAQRLLEILSSPTADSQQQARAALQMNHLDAQTVSALVPALSKAGINPDMPSDSKVWLASAMKKAAPDLAVPAMKTILAHTSDPIDREVIAGWIGTLSRQAGAAQVRPLSA